MPKTEGGTKMWCPFCKKITECKAYAPHRGKQRMRDGEENLQWFRRRGKCQECRKYFQTAEIREKHLKELVELRGALKNIKANATVYSEQATNAAESLLRLLEAMDVLKALKTHS